MKRILILTTLLIGLIAACKKPEKNAGSKSVNLHNYGDVTPPTVTNDILTFATQDEYTAWLDYLDDAVRRDSTSEDTTTTEEIFDNIESGLAFHSIRKKLRNDFDILDINGWESMDAIPELYFIGDQTILSTLNENGEVQIGTNIYSYLDKDHIIIIKDPSMLNSVRNFKNTAHTNAAEVFELTGAEQDVNISLEYVNALAFTTGVSMLKPTGGTLQMEYGAATPDACDGKRITLNGYKLQDINTPVGASFSINWGDGNTTPVGGYGALYNVSHSYASTGSYTITIYATPDPSLGYYGSYTFTQNITISSACRKDSRNSGYVWKATPDGARCTRDYISVTINSNLKRIYGSTEAYHWKNGSWHRKKADRLKMLSCMEVLHGNDCSSWYNHCDYTEHKNDAFIQAGFNVSQPFGWNVAYGDHNIYHNSSWYQHWQALSPCP